MPEGQDKIKVLYDAVSKDYNLGTYDEFTQKLQDPTKRKAFYDGVGSEYQLGTYDEFDAKIAPSKKKVDLQPIAKPLQNGAATPLPTSTASQSNVKQNNETPIIPDDVSTAKMKVVEYGGFDKPPARTALDNVKQDWFGKRVGQMDDKTLLNSYVAYGTDKDFFGSLQGYDPITKEINRRLQTELIKSPYKTANEYLQAVVNSKANKAVDVNGNIIDVAQINADYNVENKKVHRQAIAKVWSDTDKKLADETAAATQRLKLQTAKEQAKQSAIKVETPNIYPQTSDINAMLPSSQEREFMAAKNTGDVKMQQAIDNYAKKTGESKDNIVIQQSENGGEKKLFLKKDDELVPMVYDEESGRIGEKGGAFGMFAQSIGESIRNTINGVDISNATENEKNPNKALYLAKQFQKEEDAMPKKLSGKAGDNLLGNVGELAGGFLPYATPITMGLTSTFGNVNSNAQRILGDDNLTDEQKADAIAKSTKTSQDIGLLETLGFELPKVAGAFKGASEASQLLNSYKPTAVLRQDLNSTIGRINTILKETPKNVAHLATVGGGKEILNVLNLKDAGVNTDFSKVGDEALGMAKLAVGMNLGRVAMLGLKKLVTAKKAQIDKVDPNWYNKYDKAVTGQLIDIVSQPDYIYNRIMKDLSDMPDLPETKMAKDKIKEFKTYYDGLPKDLTPEQKSKALNILQSKTEAMSDYKDAMDKAKETGNKQYEDIAAMHEQKAKQYDKLLQKIISEEPLDKQQLALPSTEKIITNEPTKQATTIEETTEKQPTVPIETEVSSQPKEPISETTQPTKGTPEEISQPIELSPIDTSVKVEPKVDNATQPTEVKDKVVGSGVGGDVESRKKEMQSENDKLIKRKRELANDRDDVVTGEGKYKNFGKKERDAKLEEIRNEVNGIDSKQVALQKELKVIEAKETGGVELFDHPSTNHGSTNTIIYDINNDKLVERENVVRGKTNDISIEDAAKQKFAKTLRGANQREINEAYTNKVKEKYESEITDEINKYKAEQSTPQEVNPTPTKTEVKDKVVGSGVGGDVKPIRQLGTGANVYFETAKHRVNDDLKSGKVLLNVGSKESEMPMANIKFDNAAEAVAVAKELDKIYPNGVPDAVLIDKVVDNIKKDLLAKDKVVGSGVGGNVDLKGDKKQDWMNELVVSKDKRKADIQNDIDSFKKDESVNKLVKSFDNADDLKGFCDTISQRFADKLVEEGVDTKDIQLIEGVGLKNGLDANSAKALSDTEPKYISHIVVKIGDNVIDLTGKQFGDKYSENVIPYSEFKKNWSKVKDWRWEHRQIGKIKFALELDKYQKAISEGRMTANDAKKIIESAGLEVPKEILEQSLPTQEVKAEQPNVAEKQLEPLKDIYELFDENGDRTAYIKPTQLEKDKELNTVSVKYIKSFKENQGNAKKVYEKLLNELPSNIVGIRFGDNVVDKNIKKIYKSLGAENINGELIIKNPNYKSESLLSKEQTKAEPNVSETKVETEKIDYEPKIKEAESKYNAAKKEFDKASKRISDTQTKQQGIFGGEQKGIMPMGREEAKAILDPLREKAKKAKAEWDDLLNKKKVQDEKQQELFDQEKTTTASANKQKYAKAREIDTPTDAHGLALEYFANGGKVHPNELLNEVVGKASDADQRTRSNANAKKLAAERNGSNMLDVNSGTIKEVAHSIWDNLPEEVQNRVSDQDIRNAIIDVMGTHQTRSSVADEFIKSYHPEEAAKEYEKQLAEQMAAYEREHKDEFEGLSEDEINTLLQKEFEDNSYNAEEHFDYNLNQIENEQQINGENQKSNEGAKSETTNENESNKTNEQAGDKTTKKVEQQGNIFTESDNPTREGKSKKALIDAKKEVFDRYKEKYGENVKEKVKDINTNFEAYTKALKEVGEIIKIEC